MTKTSEYIPLSRPAFSYLARQFRLLVFKRDTRNEKNERDDEVLEGRAGDEGKRQTNGYFDVTIFLRQGRSQSELPVGGSFTPTHHHPHQL